MKCICLNYQGVLKKNHSPEDGYAPIGSDLVLVSSPRKGTGAIVTNRALQDAPILSDQKPSKIRNVGLQK